MIVNCNLRKRLGMSRLMDADTGANSGGNSGAETTETEEQKETTQTEKTFTQKDLDKIIQDRLSKEQSKWEKKVQEEKTEAEKLAKMKADEKAKYQEEKRLAEIEKREKDITTRELKAQAYETLAEKGLPKDLVEILNYADAESCNKSIDAVEKAFQGAVEKAVNEKLKGNPPKQGTGTSSSDASLRAAFGLK